MNIFSSFWNVLTMENEMVTKIVTAPTVFVEAWLGYLLIFSLLKIDSTPPQKITYIIFISLLTLVTEFLIPIPYNVIFNYLVLFIFILSYLKLTISQTILAVVFPSAVFAIVGNLILNPILKLLNIQSAQLTNCILYRMIYLFLLYLTVYILTRLLKRQNTNFGIFKNLNRRCSHLVSLNLFLACVTIAIQLIITFYYINTYSIMFSLLNFISLLTYIIISFYSLKRVLELQLTTVQLENAESYNTTLSILYDNVKAFKHDFDNMIFTIGGFINTNDIEGLQVYYKSLEKECQQLNNLSFLNPALINNPGIYNLLTVKYQRAKNENVEIQLDFFFDLNKLRMPIYDFSRMFGIFLDNAIEAASVSDEKIVKILFRDSQNTCRQIIQIENSYSNKSINTKTIFQKGVTEKENHLGMGLWEVNQILNRNNNINLITENNDTYFKQRLEIYY